MTANKVKSYIDTRPFEEFVKDAQPTGAYDGIAFMIDQDMKRQGEFKLYQGKCEYYEGEKMKLVNNIQTVENEINSIKSRIDKARETIDDNQLKISEAKKSTEADKKQIKQMIDQIPKLEKIISENIDEIQELEQDLVTLKKELSEHEWMEVCYRHEFYGLSRVRNEYFKSKDLEYLRKGVHAVCSYADQLRYGSKYVAPYKGHPLKESESPFSEDVTARKNYDSNYQWFKDGKFVEDW